MILIGADNDVYWDALRFSKNGTYINDATMTFTLKDSAGVNVTGAVSVAMTYQTASNGDYVGVLPSSVTAALTDGAAYEFVITATNYNLQRRKWDVAGKSA